MLSAIDELFYGNVTPLSRQIPANSEYRQIMRQHAEKHIEFMDKLRALSPTLFETYDQLCGQESELEEDELRRMFKMGFSLGLNLGLETLSEIEKLSYYTPSV